MGKRCSFQAPDSAYAKTRASGAKYCAAVNTKCNIFNPLVAANATS